MAFWLQHWPEFQYPVMTTATVTIRWPQGLHLRAISRLVRVAQGFRSQIYLQLESNIADARSAVSLLLLGAPLGTELNVQALGEDEHEAIRVLQNFFADQEAGEGVSAVGS